MPTVESPIAETSINHLVLLPPRWLFMAIVLVAIVLRALMFPHFDETRNMDEVGYLKGSLAMLEGDSAGYKAAPAGPNLWVGWLYTAGSTVQYVIKPTAEEAKVPMQVRPFVALNHALFNQYHDLRRLHYVWIGSQFILSVLAVAAGYRVGVKRGGFAGGLFLGGFLAVLPLFVEYTDMSRPYMTAWSFGVLAVWAAACGSGRKRVVWSGIFIGLAVASRVEMLAFAPVVMWEFWHRRETKRIVYIWTVMLGIMAITALLTAPWLLTHLIGNLRTIATVRGGPSPQGRTTLKELALQLSWTEGLGGALIAVGLVVLALLLPNRRWMQNGAPVRFAGRFRIACLTVFVLLLLASLGHGTVYLQQQGPVVLAVLMLGTVAAGVLENTFSKAARWIVLAALIVPLWQTAVVTYRIHQDYAPDPSTAWLAANVPANTRVYINYQLQDPLPTLESSKRLWTEVTDDKAWRTKFAAGLERFGLSVDEMPRAMSEENMVQERGNRREFFILGSRPWVPERRFDIYLYDSSPVFDLHDVTTEFKKTGGVLIWRGVPNTDLGTPIKSWRGRDGAGIFIYASPEIQLNVGDNLKST